MKNWLAAAFATLALTGVARAEGSEEASASNEESPAGELNAVRHGLYVEDVFVLPEHRGRGIGTMIFRDLARRALAQGCARMEWSVLDWNEPSIRFYRGIGAKPMDEWTVQRLTGDALAAMAK